MKNPAAQNLVLKIETSRLKKAKWKLTLPLQEAKKNGEVVALGESLIMRWICELNGVTNRNEQVSSLRMKIKALKKLPSSLDNRKNIREMYEKLDELLYIKDYVLVIMNTAANYRKIVKDGFEINGVKYRRLLGTPGGVKTATIVFVSERIYPELWNRIENGRDMTVPMVPGKLDSYRSLVCSASTPMSMPKGVVIVSDVETAFKSDVINLSHDETDEPVMEFVKDADVSLDISDGMGLMTPELAERWSNDLGLDYVTGGICIRYAFTKGMVFTFPILEYADNVAGTRIIKDIYGRDVDLSDVELVLTESQVKLWKSYPTTEDFIRNCQDNNYTFSATKIAPPTLENERTLNLLVL